MKTVMSVSSIVCMLLMMTAGLNTAQAQRKNEDKSAAIRELVASRNFVFKAQTVMPMSGRVRQLNYDYDLRVARDSIVCYLPYFGRAYAPPLNPSEGGFQFTSKDFEYNEEQTKKGEWNILIKPKDVHDVQQLRLNIFENGNASLQITSNNRQPILFNGYITDRNDKK